MHHPNCFIPICLLLVMALDLAGNMAAPFYVAGGICFVAGLVLIPTIGWSCEKNEATNRMQDEHITKEAFRTSDGCEAGTASDGDC